MCFKLSLFCAALALLTAAEKPSGSVDGAIEFGKSADGVRKDAAVFGYDAGLSDNEVADSLRNFKSLHNATDLEALASDVHHNEERVGAAGSQQEQVADDRVDNNPRVHRGAGGGLDHPLFTPYKHNKIDTADFSDCALQGEWKPIGGPIHDNYIHHEDHQKEHFHAAAESPDVFPNIAESVPSTHGSLTSEGIAFWNQFNDGSNHKQNGPFNHEKIKHFQKQPFPTPLHSQLHKQRPSPLKKFPSAPAPSSQLSLNDFDVFQNIRDADSDYNVFKIQQKPSYDSPQTLLAPAPLISDINYSLVPNTPKEHLPPHGSRDSEDYLSPPPVPPVRLPLSNPDKPKPIQPPRQKYPNKGIKTPQKIRGPSGPGPLRSPPAPVNEHRPDFNKGYGSPHHSIIHHGPQLSENHGHGHHSHNPHHEQQHHHHQENHGHGPSIHTKPHHDHHDQHHIQENRHNQDPPHYHHHKQQHPSDSSTFTCGHNHAEGTNYHTASYQVEGESDPSLLEDESGGNPFEAPIIVGQPSFQHNNHFENEDNDDELTGENNSRHPKNSYPPLDQEDEGTEQENVAREGGYVSANPYAEKLTQTSSIPEEVTKSSILDTTAPQKFQTEPFSSESFILKDNVHDSDTQFPAFDHSSFSKVDFSSFNSPPESKVQSSKSEHFGGPVRDIVSEFYTNSPQLQFKDHHHSESPGTSESEGFLGSSFTSPFYEGSINSDGPPSAPPPRHIQKPSFAQSYSEFSFNDFNVKPPTKGKYHKASVAVFDHHGPPYNKTKVHQPPPKKRPHKHYEVNENSGEMIPVSAFFPPKKGPRQFNNRTPNLAVPIPKDMGPKSLPPPNPPKFQSTLHFDGSNLDIYQSNPRNKVTKIKLKPKRGRVVMARYPESDFRRSLTIMSRIK